MMILINKTEYESVLKKQKQNYFFKKRFKSQRNQSVNPGSYSNSSKLNLPDSASQQFQQSESETNQGNTSLLVTHEKLNLKSHPSSVPTTNYSIGGVSPKSIDDTASTKRSNFQSGKNFNDREPTSYYSSLGNKPKS